MDMFMGHPHYGFRNNNRNGMSCLAFDLRIHNNRSVMFYLFFALVGTVFGTFNYPNGNKPTPTAIKEPKTPER